MNHWTSRYFGRLYHQIYSEHLLDAQRALDEAAFASHVLDLGRRKVLDVACGYGRHARLLATSNKVVALDFNRDYVKAAREGAADRVAQNLWAVQGDMRHLPLADRSMDAAVMLFNSFGYFGAEETAEQAAEAGAENRVNSQVWKLPNVFYERQLVDSGFGRLRDPEQPAGGSTGNGDAEAGAGPDDAENLQVLREILRVLKPGGGLLLEVPNRRPLLEAVDENPRRLMVMEGCEVHEEFEWRGDVCRLINKTRFVADGSEEAATYSLRLYEPAELKNLLREAGFIVRRMYGDYMGDRFRPAASDVLLLHVTRPAR